MRFRELSINSRCFQFGQLSSQLANIIFNICYTLGTFFTSLIFLQKKENEIEPKFVSLIHFQQRMNFVVFLAN